MIKLLSLLVLSTLAISALGQMSLADEFDRRESAQERAAVAQQDQQEYAREQKRIAGSNQEVLSRVHSLAHSSGGTAKNLRCYVGPEFAVISMNDPIGDSSEYTWQTVDGVPVGRAIPQHSSGNVIGEIAMSPFTIASALRGSDSNDEQPAVQDTYTPEIGVCRFQVGSKYCSVTKYVDGNDEERALIAKCL